MPELPRLHPLLLFCDSARLLRRGFGARIRDLELSEPQWRVIGVVFRIPGISQRDLALILGAGKAPLAELVARLVAGGWLQRQIDPSDRRSRKLQLTPQALRPAAILRARYLDLCAELAANLEGDWDALQQALAVLGRAHAGPALNAALAPMALHGQLHLLSVLCRQLRYQLRQWLAGNELNHNHWLVLAALGHYGQVAQQQLVLELGLAKVALAQTLAQMDRSGWLRREIDSGDRRRRLLALTEAGREQWRRVEQATDLWLEAWLQPLIPDQRRILIDGLDRLHTHLLNLAVAAASSDENQHYDG